MSAPGAIGVAPEPASTAQGGADMPDTTCSIDGCNEGGKLVRGWCSKHYQRWKNHGDPTLIVAVRYNGEACSIDGCDERVRARGWCQAHYNRWKSHGDPLAGGPSRIRGNDVARFWSKVDKTETCWLWVGGLNSNGYGSLKVGKRTIPGHRYAYELLVGPIPEGLQIDHLCRVRHCVNPDHLEAVTPAENTRRGLWGALYVPVSHCVHGHAFDEENTAITPDGYRRCRACARAAWHRKRSAA